MSYIKGQERVWSIFREVAVRHLESGSPPGDLEELHLGAELWAFNTDFSLEFPQPLMPYTVLVGGLLNKPAKPPEQVSSLDTHIQIHQREFTSVYFLLLIFLTRTYLWTFTPPNAQPSLSFCLTQHSAYFLCCPYPNPSDTSGSSVVDLQLWRGRVHCRDSGLNGLLGLCEPSACGAGRWLLQYPSGCALEVKGFFTFCVTHNAIFFTIMTRLNQPQRKTNLVFSFNVRMLLVTVLKPAVFCLQV